MKRDMRKWLEELQAAPVKKAMPVLSFPAVQLLGISVKELISDSDRQAEAISSTAFLMASTYSPLLALPTLGTSRAFAPTATDRRRA